MAALPKVKAPPGACDTHIHIYGPTETYKLAPTSPFPPPTAPVSAFRDVMRRLGTERAVVVQPAAYGKDNACTLDAVRELGLDRTRAVVVVDEAVTDGELDRLTQAGARAIRFHMFKGGVLGWDIIERMSERVKAFGWHVQLQLDGRALPEKRATIERLAGTVVIDHTGKFLEPVAPDHEAFKVLQSLVDTGRFWVKLSAPYETSKAGPPDYRDVGALAKDLIERAPERMLWASNWPHPSAQPDPPDDAMLLDVLGYWCPDEAVRNRILADNPARLYGFA
ncbi:MAG TPA: amidohydrolase family protein [Aestuariivirgaceae bacterium]|nr:amidohydrolase family protein [Aestuariivirgaceae bacterium]